MALHKLAQPDEWCAPQDAFSRHLITAATPACHEVIKVHFLWTFSGGDEMHRHCIARCTATGQFFAAFEVERVDLTSAIEPYGPGRSTVDEAEADLI